MEGVQSLEILLAKLAEPSPLLEALVIEMSKVPNLFKAGNDDIKKNAKHNMSKTTGDILEKTEKQSKSKETDSDILKKLDRYFPQSLMPDPTKNPYEALKAKMYDMMSYAKNKVQESYQKAKKSAGQVRQVKDSIAGLLLSMGERVGSTLLSEESSKYFNPNTRKLRRWLGIITPHTNCKFCRIQGLWECPIHKIIYNKGEKRRAKAGAAAGATAATLYNSNYSSSQAYSRIQLTQLFQSVFQSAYAK